MICGYARILVSFSVYVYKRNLVTENETNILGLGGRNMRQVKRWILQIEICFTLLLSLGVLLNE